MCRNIHTLHNFEPAATSDEVYAAALQYVRKISGYPKPSAANAAPAANMLVAIAPAIAVRMMLDITPPID